MDLKPYGAFIEHTARPLIEEATILLKEIARTGMEKKDIQAFFKKLAFLHVLGIVLDTLKAIICTAIIGFVVWKIYP